MTNDESNEGSGLWRALLANFRCDLDDGHDGPHDSGDDAYTASLTIPAKPGTYLVEATVDDSGLHLGEPKRFDLEEAMLKDPHVAAMVGMRAAEPDEREKRAWSWVLERLDKLEGIADAHRSKLDADWRRLNKLEATVAKATSDEADEAHSVLAEAGYHADDGEVVLSLASRVRNVLFDLKEARGQSGFTERLDILEAVQSHHELDPARTLLGIVERVAKKATLLDDIAERWLAISASDRADMLGFLGSKLEECPETLAAQYVLTALHSLPLADNFAQEFPSRKAVTVDAGETSPGGPEPSAVKS